MVTPTHLLANVALVILAASQQKKTVRAYRVCGLMAGTVKMAFLVVKKFTQANTNALTPNPQKRAGLQLGIATKQRKSVRKVAA